MVLTDTFTKLKQLHRRLNGCTISYDCNAYMHAVLGINDAAHALAALSDGALKTMSKDLRSRAMGGEPLDHLLVAAFALVKETVGRVLGMTAFDQQLAAGAVLHHGKLAEMQTGEGKTLAAVFPAYLNALTGRGVHVLTFNDYLANRDAHWMGPVYEFLGLRVGRIRERLTAAKRREAYAADVTYVTAKESGFDFLRDSLCYDPSDIVQRELNVAIIDEADSILIDEARIPLVIAETPDASSPKPEQGGPLEYRLAHLVRDLRQHEEFQFDLYARNIHLTETGLRRVESMLSSENLYAPENLPLLARVQHALHAQYLLHRDKDYIVREGEVQLVDECTGRVAYRRRWPEGLHGAVEAKEGCPMERKSVILNSITLQHFLSRYAKLCGMTATAQSAEEELRQFYGLDIVVIAQHKSAIRVDLPDIVYRSGVEKYDAILDEIIRTHATGRPILVGTHSVNESERIAGMARLRGLICEVLNAKRDALEAAIIARAGRLGAITIATNMAGRGTDIKLGGSDPHEKKRVEALGGLYVLGANRFESRRIDDQLKGRCARQGDPGSTRFIISLEDPLCLRYKLNELVGTKILDAHETGPIDNPILRLELQRLQRIIEGQHLEVKKTLYAYSLALEHQREVLFDKRNDALVKTDFLRVFQSRCKDRFAALVAKHGEEAVARLCRSLLLNSIDRAWSGHLADAEEIRAGIHLRVYGKENPHFEYNKCLIDLFSGALQSLEDEAVDAFMRYPLDSGDERDLGALKAPAATWTYLVNDKPFEDGLARQMIGNTGLGLWAGFLWPLMVIFFVVKKLQEKKSRPARS